MSVITTKNYSLVTSNERVIAVFCDPDSLESISDTLEKYIDSWYEYSISPYVDLIIKPTYTLDEVVTTIKQALDTKFTEESK